MTFTPTMTLDPAALAATRVLVVHGVGCPDGIASMILLADAFPEARRVFVTYNDVSLSELEAEPGMLFCDITPPRERVAEFIAVGALVLDHHRSAESIVAAFGPRGVFADEEREPGVSGAVLAFCHVWEPVTGCHGGARWRNAADFASLAGLRDTWQRKEPRWREACAQAAALRFWPVEELLDLRSLHDSSVLWTGLAEKMEIGPVLLSLQEARDRRAIAEAYRFTAGGIRVLAFEGGDEEETKRAASDVADLVGDEADLVIGWHCRIQGGERQMALSCRSRGTFSAQAFAKAHEGGGHVNAAGCVLPLSPFNPYTSLRAVVECYASTLETRP